MIQDGLSKIQSLEDEAISLAKLSASTEHSDYYDRMMQIIISEMIYETKIYFKPVHKNAMYDNSFRNNLTPNNL